MEKLCFLVTGERDAFPPRFPSGLEDGVYKMENSCVSVGAHWCGGL